MALKPVARRHSDALTRVGWDQLETLLAAYYRSEGYEVEHVGTGATGASTDGGIDLKLRRGEQYVVVQCKHWNAMKVPHNAVHELLGLMVNHGATGAILATSGEFTKAAIEAATRQGHVQLIDGNELRMMLGPIREPAPALDVRMAGAEGAGVTIAHRVGERLLSAAEDRIRHGGGGRGGRTATRSPAVVFAVRLLAVVLFLALVAVMYVFVTRTLLNTVTPAAPRTTSAPVAPAAAIPASVQANGQPCHEIIDAPSGTYIDHCAPASKPSTSPAQAHEQQRRAEEAMKIIADSTPEAL